VVAEVPRVREDYGYPPLVTPTSQIVGTQAVFNVLGGERYKMVTEESKNYLKGMYGKPPGEINEEVRRKVIGSEEYITCRPADKLEPEWDKLKAEYKDIAESEEDVLTLALFPQAARKFLESRKAGTLRPEAPPAPPKEAAAPAAKPAATVAAPFTGTMAFRVTVNQRPYEVVVAPSGEVAAATPTPAASNPHPAPAAAPASPAAAVSGTEVKAPVLGKITRIVRRPGDAVAKGDLLLILEAMKMENEIQAPVSGKVLAVRVVEGQDVNPGDVMVVVG